MAFITGSITNANPGPTLYALIETAALGIGWTLDDTVVIGGNTHKVLKSAAAGNTYGLDWFLDINYPTTGITGGMRFAPFEGYTAASDVGLRGPFGHASVTTLDATTYSRYGATTSALETNWTNSASATTLSATLSVSTFSYWISITRDRIIFLSSLDTQQMLYTGFFTPSAAHAAQAGASMFPLVMLRTTSTGASGSAGTIASATMAFTRLPKLSAMSGSGWAASAQVPSTSSLLAIAAGGTVGSAVSDFTNQTTIVPLTLSMGTGSGATGSYGFVGTLDGLAVGYITSGAVRGDTITVGSDTWYATTALSLTALFLKGV